MDMITAFLTNDHKLCDDRYFLVKADAERKNWEAAKERFAGFIAAISRHIDVEEQLLFPSFEKAFGAHGGPTQVMRMEHAEIRKYLDAMNDAIKLKNVTAFAGASDHFWAVLEPHSAKEEQVLYPMCDQHLEEDILDLLTKIKGRLA